MKKLYVIILAVLLGLIILFFYFKKEKVYTSNEYSPSGKLIGTNEYVLKSNGPVAHGKFVNYNEKGIKIAEGQFVEGEINGKCIYYYDNGEIESIYYRKNSKVDLESTLYNRNGFVYKYVMFNAIGEPKFIIDFDEKAVKKYDGYVIYPVEQSKIVKDKKYKIEIGSILKVGDVIKYKYLSSYLHKKHLYL